jgi:hypothetical protein
LDGISGAALVRTVREIKHNRSTELAGWLKAIFLECVKKREWSNTRCQSANGQVERGEDDQITRSDLQLLGRAGPAKGPEKEFGHGGRAREGAHRTEALQEVSTSIPKGA